MLYRVRLEGYPSFLGFRSEGHPSGSAGWGLGAGHGPPGLSAKRVPGVTQLSSVGNPLRSHNSVAVTGAT